MLMRSNWIFWVSFNVFVLAMLALDLGVFRRRKHDVGFREAMGWTIAWVGLAGLFAVMLHWFGQTMVGSGARPNSQLSLEFITGYVIEQSLSVDNLFIFLLIFRYFQVPRRLQHGVLFWGVLGALVMRGIFIFAGVALLDRFAWISYVFGAILVYSGIRILRDHGAQVDPESNVLLRGFRKLFRVTPEFEGGRFFVRRDALLYATPLALVLVLLETTDVLFAVDSIPAVLAVTREPFIVYTSNVFAILGLRSLFFVLSGMIETFHLLHYGLSAILILIGAKMLASNYVEVPTVAALAAVASILLLSVLLSLLFPERPKAHKK
jgi:tellurite resistance protein TerC